MSNTKEHVVITGGAGELARALAKECRIHGLEVWSPARDMLDVSSADSIRSYFKQREVDLLVCNAGITRDAPLVRLTEMDWQEVIAVNYNGALQCAQAALPAMKRKGGGHVVFISSFSAQHPPIGQNAYATAKAALLGLVSDLSVRHGAENIRINAILPGFLETRMTKTVSAGRRLQVLDHHTLGRFNTCAQVAAFIRFLHLQMPHTSGQSFQLDSRLPNW